MNILLSWLLNAAALLITSHFISGFSIDTTATALLASCILAIINSFIRPLLLLITLPINVVTLGLFTFIINAITLSFTAKLVSGFYIEDFTTAILSAILLAIISTILSLIRHHK